MNVDQLSLELAAVRAEGLVSMLRSARECHRNNRTTVVSAWLREADDRVREISVQLQDMIGR